MADIQTVLKSQREYFQSGITKDLAYRADCLKELKSEIIKHEEDIIAAMYNDFKKPPFEVYATEIAMVLQEIKHTLKHLKSWARPFRVKTPYAQFPGKSYVYPEPYGTVLVIAPWNYPFLLAFAPVIGAVSAGNCVVLKPSEYAPNTSKVISGIIWESLPKELITVFEGDKRVSEELLTQRFDYIFFTGSTMVGKLVMQAAAKHLTPVTLELGGKSPCIVDEDADIALAARRIAWGKFVNAGQTCIAPDYILVSKKSKMELLERIQSCIKEFYGDDPLGSPDYARIINKRHFERLKGLMDDKKVVIGGTANEDELYISPTVMEQMTWEDSVMQEEIFGPLLPVMEYDDLSEAISIILKQPRPLALYYFTSNRKNQQRVIKEIPCGGICINDTIMHASTPYLPFGGIGDSGMGSYHGRSGFDTFSHQKSVYRNSTGIDLPFRYPPYEKRLGLIRRISLK